ncbi:MULTISPECIES: hypothetical protein [unclassified Lactobacillus]|nr:MULTISPECIES: hypothetical protein [unclassified Lactobacillus]
MNSPDGDIEAKFTFPGSMILTSYMQVTTPLKIIQLRPMTTLLA